MASQVATKAVKKPAAAKKAAAPKKAAAAKEPVAAKKPAAAAPAPKKEPAQKHESLRRPKIEPWDAPVLFVRTEGKPEDPRLAAALAARERWHGRSGRPALKSGTQAVAFARERRLVHPVVSSALPNLVDPVLGRTCTTVERTTGQPATVLGAWQREISAASDLSLLRLCFEQPTLVEAQLWPSVATVAHELDSRTRKGHLLTEEAVEALEVIDRKGSIPSERLRAQLGLNPKDFARVQGELEARLCIATRPDFDDDDKPIVLLQPIEKWTTRCVPGRRPELHQAWTILFAAAVRSAVVLFPQEAETLFPWRVDERERAIATAHTAQACTTYVEAGSPVYVASPVPR